MALTISAAAEAAQAASLVLKPRVIACVAGAYADGSEHCLSLEHACAVIRATRGNAFVIHIPRPDRVPRQVLPIEALFDAYEARGDVVPLVNTSRARTALEALAMITSGRIVYEALARHFPIDNPATQVGPFHPLARLAWLAVVLAVNLTYGVNYGGGEISDTLSHETAVQTAHAHSTQAG